MSSEFRVSQRGSFGQGWRFVSLNNIYNFKGGTTVRETRKKKENYFCVFMAPCRVCDRQTINDIMQNTAYRA